MNDFLIGALMVFVFFFIAEFVLLGLCRIFGFYAVVRCV